MKDAIKDITVGVPAVVQWVKDRRLGLGSGIGLSCSSDSITDPGASMCHGCNQKRLKKGCHNDLIKRENLVICNGVDLAAWPQPDQWGRDSKYS